VVREAGGKSANAIRRGTGRSHALFVFFFTVALWPLVLEVRKFLDDRMEFMLKLCIRVGGLRWILDCMVFADGSQELQIVCGLCKLKSRGSLAIIYSSSRWIIKGPEHRRHRLNRTTPKHGQPAKRWTRREKELHHTSPMTRSAIQLSLSKATQG
jgi:hypothetical protein